MSSGYRYQSGFTIEIGELKSSKIQYTGLKREETSKKCICESVIVTARIYRIFIQINLWRTSLGTSIYATIIRRF